jgi:hypothetical protein
MKKIISFLIILAVLATPALSADFSDFNFDSIKTDYNQGFEDAPWIVKTIAGTEKINFQIIGESTTALSIETKDGKILSISQTPLENPTLVIEVSEEQMTEILSSGNPLESLASSLRNKELKIEGNGIGMSLKLFLMGIIIFILDFVTTIGSFVKPIA